MSDYEWPSKIDQAISAGFEPSEDYNAPIAEHLRPPAGVNALQVFAAQVDHALGVVRCSHPTCRTSLQEDTVVYCPHRVAFCDMCTFEEWCDECAIEAAKS